MESIKGKHILISGASLAGLSTAHWLIKYGFIVTSVERASHIRPGGQAVDVREIVFEIAKRMGILDDSRKKEQLLN